MTDKPTPTDIDILFNEAVEPAPNLSMALMANILADAAKTSAARIPFANPVAVTPKRRILERVKGMFVPIGGLRAGLALAACAVIGLTAGYAGTDRLESVPGMGTLVSAISGDPVNDYGFGYSDTLGNFLTEG